jgi:hypothetical protein
MDNPSVDFDLEEAAGIVNQRLYLKPILYSREFSLTI